MTSDRRAAGSEPPVSPFNATRIRAELPPGEAALLTGLTLLAETDSTNRALARLPSSDRHAHVVLADSQTAGRGRRQRNWHSPPGGNLYLSCGWRFGSGPESLAPLPLACAVIAARELERLGAAGIAIKWPNDLLLGGRKLGGILVESSISRPARIDVIVGIGINVAMRADDATGQAIDQPWTDLASKLPAAGDAAFRDRLAGRLIGGTLSGLNAFEEEGFAPFRDDWARCDAVAGSEVRLTGDHDTVTGTALGISPDGALRVRIDHSSGHSEVREYLAGDVSVRPVLRSEAD